MPTFFYHAAILSICAQNFLLLKHFPYVFTLSLFLKVKPDKKKAYVPQCWRSGPFLEGATAGEKKGGRISNTAFCSDVHTFASHTF